MSPRTDCVVEPVLNHKSVLGEGPLWDERRNVICWVDILSNQIHQYFIKEKAHKILDVKEMVGTIALCEDGNFIAALKNGLFVVDSDNGSAKHLLHPEAHLPGNRFNDGKCDPAGRFWVGSMALSEEGGAGNLYKIDRDLSSEKIIPNVSISNGLAWRSDHKVFYYIDTPTREVASYDFDKETGKITNRKTVIRFVDDDGFPDGMTIDTEDKLWIAHWDGWQVSRWNPSNGKKIFSVALPVARVTSCTFGGETMSDLYITTASVGLSESESRQQPLAGSLFVVKNMGVSGLHSFRFDNQ